MYKWTASKQWLFAILSCNTAEDLLPQIPAMETEMCLKGGTKGGARLALGINITSSRCVIRCVLCFVENEAKLEHFPYASLQKIQKKKRWNICHQRQEEIILARLLIWTLLLALQWQPQSGKLLEKKASVQSSFHSHCFLFLLFSYLIYLMRKCHKFLVAKTVNVLNPLWAIARFTWNMKINT